MSGAIQQTLTYEDICNDPHFANLPYKIETDEFGRIIMSPHRMQHGNYQSKIDRQMAQLRPEWEGVIEAAIRTNGGTKVADIAFYSPERWKKVQDDIDTELAGEICVEVRSVGNPDQEMKAKRELYFEAGAQECWEISLDGKVRFFDPKGELADSKLVPGFPETIS